MEPELFGRDLFGEPIRPKPSSLLASRFIVPPFSVLNARDGEWQDRKRGWAALGIQSEIGRSATGANAWNDLALNPREAESTRKIAAVGDGPTIFDPVLCELAYTWFVPPGGQIIDPFAGGSVRGIVAASLGFKYWGCDLRPEQIEANRAQAEAIDLPVPPVWVAGDALDALPSAPQADFIFTCPPYGDLERYSDDPRDLSTMDYHAFVAAYKRVILRACLRLKENRFAAFVVGNFRNGRGIMRDFVSDTVAAFKEQRLDLYNEAVLVTCAGSLPMRAGGQFAASRKLGKTHQNLLVFVRGNPELAAAAVSREAA